MANRDHSLADGIVQAAYSEFLASGFQKASVHKIAEKADCRAPLGVADAVSDSPPGNAECLRKARNRDGSLPHPRKRRGRNMNAIPV